MDTVFSAHNIEHQPDLVSHLQQAGAILAKAGRFFLAIPDRRYCFDNFLPDTNFADVLLGYCDRRIWHVAGSLFEHRLLTTHNETQLHWAGQHSVPPLALPVTKETGESIRRIMGEITEAPGCFDSHAWQFTPPSFRHLIDALGTAGLIPFKVERIYPIVRNGLEFYAVRGRIWRLYAPPWSCRPSPSRAPSRALSPKPGRRTPGRSPASRRAPGRGARPARRPWGPAFRVRRLHRSRSRFRCVSRRASCRGGRWRA